MLVQIESVYDRSVRFEPGAPRGTLHIDVSRIARGALALEQLFERIEMSFDGTIYWGAMGSVASPDPEDVSK